MQSFRVSMRFSRLKDVSLGIFAGSIIMNMTNNPVYLNPLVPLNELSDLEAAFSNACAMSLRGGRVLIAIKNKCRANLLSALQRQASYVQSIARHDLLNLLSSGYTQTSRNNFQSQLATPNIRKILTEEHQNKLVLQLTFVANARSYQIQMQTGDGAWEDAGFSSKARRIVVAGLKSGMTYNFRARAIGGSTGTSDWSSIRTAMPL